MRFQEICTKRFMMQESSPSLTRTEIENHAFGNQDLLERLEQYLDAFMASPMSQALLALEQRLVQLPLVEDPPPPCV